MTTENQEVKETLQTEVVETPQVSEVEQRALEQGWRPKDQWEGSEDDFIDAKEFVRRKPLFDKIEAQNKQLKTVTQAINQLKAHYTNIEKASYERALADLKAKQKAALSEGDLDQYHELGEQISDAKEQVKTIEKQRGPAVEEAPATHPEFQAWVSRNSWYESTPHMRMYAEEVGQRLHRTNPELPPSAILEKVSEAVRKEFPNKFQNPNRERAGSVEGGTSKSSTAKSDGITLSDQERKIMNDLIRSKVLTKEEYIAQLKKAKGQ